MTPSTALQKAMNDQIPREFESAFTQQVEEEKSSAQVLESLRRVGENQAALVMLDRELGQRNSNEMSEKKKS